MPIYSHSGLREHKSNTLGMRIEVDGTLPLLTMVLCQDNVPMFDCATFHSSQSAPTLQKKKKSLNDLSVDGISQSVHHTAKQLLTHRNIHNGPSPLYDVTLLDQLVITEHHNTNVVRLQVQRHTLVDNNVNLLANNFTIIYFDAGEIHKDNLKLACSMIFFSKIFKRKQLQSSFNYSFDLL